MQGHRHSELLYTSALASFQVYGPCEFALSWLRRAHQANKHVLLFLAGNAIPKLDIDDYMGWGWAAKFHGQLAHFTWSRAPGALDWLKANADGLSRRACDGLGCKKVEDKPGGFSTCGKCKVSQYCGVACQKSDWVAGGHKGWCGLRPLSQGKW